MTKGIKKLIAVARKNVSQQIRSDAGYGRDLSQRGSFFARGTAGEGFNGGYMAALDDVLLALNGVIPQRSWWETPPNNGLHRTGESCQSEQGLPNQK